MKTLIIIPSRMSATRLPGKPLLKINGQSIISHVFKRAESANIGDVIVATEDREILDEVKNNVLKSNYPENKIHFIKMDVRDEKKLDDSIKSNIGILRLDTDFYDSTLSILNALYSKVTKGGYIIHDDYGHWKGAKKAVDEYFEKNNFLFLHRIDYSSRLLVKT